MFVRPFVGLFPLGVEAAVSWFGDGEIARPWEDAALWLAVSAKEVLRGSEMGHLQGADPLIAKGGQGMVQEQIRGDATNLQQLESEKNKKPDSKVAPLV